jgi:hypothetical protein
MSDSAQDTRYGGRLIAQRSVQFWRKTIIMAAHLRFLPVRPPFAAMARAPIHPILCE